MRRPAGSSTRPAYLKPNLGGNTTTTTHAHSAMASTSRAQTTTRIGALAACDLPAARAEAVHGQAREILARRRRRARWGLPTLAALGRVAEPLFATGLGTGFFLWLVARCLQIYGLLPA